MNNTKLALSGILMMVMLTACNQGANEPEQSPLESNIEQASYVIGYNSIQQLVSRGDLTLDDTAIMNGVTDALKGKDSRLTEEVTQQAMQQFQADMQAKAESVKNEASAANLAAGIAYMEANAKNSDVTVDISGFQYKVLTEGLGNKPSSETSTVKVNYEGRLIDGTIFDSSYERGEPIEFALNRVIKGWTKAVQLMPEGATWEVTIPPELG